MELRRKRQPSRLALEAEETNLMVDIALAALPTRKKAKSAIQNMPMPNAQEKAHVVVGRSKPVAVPLRKPLLAKDGKMVFAQKGVNNQQKLRLPEYQRNALFAGELDLNSSKTPMGAQQFPKHKEVMTWIANPPATLREKPDRTAPSYDSRNLGNKQVKRTVRFSTALDVVMNVPVRVATTTDSRSTPQANAKLLNLREDNNIMREVELNPTRRRLPRAHMQTRPQASTNTQPKVDLGDDYMTTRAHARMKRRDTGQVEDDEEKPAPIVEKPKRTVNGEYGIPLEQDSFHIDLEEATRTVHIFECVDRIEKVRWIFHGWERNHDIDMIQENSEDTNKILIPRDAKYVIVNEDLLCSPWGSVMFFATWDAATDEYELKVGYYFCYDKVTHTHIPALVEFFDQHLEPPVPGVTLALVKRHERISADPYGPGYPRFVKIFNQMTKAVDAEFNWRKEHKLLNWLGPNRRRLYRHVNDVMDQ
jgi:hypothetical protein